MKWADQERHNVRTLYSDGDTAGTRRAVPAVRRFGPGAELQYRADSNGFGGAAEAACKWPGSSALTLGPYPELVQRSQGRLSHDQCPVGDGSNATGVSHGIQG